MHILLLIVFIIIGIIIWEVGESIHNNLVSLLGASILFFTPVILAIIFK